ncbi:MAG: thioredoxin-disulfide reductase [Dehalococcoidia bacterium]|nr:thioredoxin-disulfide reductase [Dehalococcoidia bacterium]
MAEEYDIAIIGGGPAGMSAGLYAARGQRSTILFERGVIGGQIALTEAVENYPGFPDGVNGFDLAQNMLKQAEKYGQQTKYSAATEVKPVGEKFEVTASDGDVLTAKTVIITAGADYNRLGIPGEDRLIGRGVSYCATCDAAFFRDMEVAVVGGGDAAMDEGLYTTKYASKSTVIHRRDQLRASAILQERAFANAKMDFVWDTVVDEVLGEEQVEGVKVRDLKTGKVSTMDVSAIFVFIGQTPNTDFVKDLVERDPMGHILVNEWMETGVPGLYAAGDARQNAARQVASSVGDGVTAAIRAEHYLSDRYKD